MLAKTTPRQTQESRRAVAEERLLNAALDIVSRRGSTGMTLSEVGTEAGYSRGLPAHCFGSKEGLLRRLSKHIRDRFDTLRKSEPKRTPGMDGLRGGVTLYFKQNETCFSETRATLIMMSEALLEGAGMREGISEYNQQILAGLKANVIAGQRCGEIRADLDAAAVAALILGAMRGVMLQHLLHEGVPLEKTKLLLLDMLERMLIAPPKA